MTHSSDDRAPSSRQCSLVQAVHRGHSTARMAGYAAKKMNATLLALTHFSHRFRHWSANANHAQHSISRWRPKNRSGDELLFRRQTSSAFQSHAYPMNRVEY
ncbi:Metallo-beta-lactamase [Phytophthora cactorum]|nr:Metallo-beta-lactamase [Phytophthora cactorum]